MHRAQSTLSPNGLKAALLTEPVTESGLWNMDVMIDTEQASGDTPA